MSHEVRFTSAARADIFEAAQNYAEVDEDLGADFIDTAIDLAYSLVENPRRYKEVRSGIRQAVIARF